MQASLDRRLAKISGRMRDHTNEFFNILPQINTFEDFPLHLQQVILEAERSKNVKVETREAEDGKISYHVVLSDCAYNQSENYCAATYDGKCLQIVSIDTGESPQSFFCRSSYEYNLSVSNENMVAFAEHICAPLRNPEEFMTRLVERFWGYNAAKEIREFCEERGIDYQTFGW